MIKSALRAALAAAITLTPAAVLADDKGKCYGVAKAGHNDCAAKTIVIPVPLRLKMVISYGS